MGYHPRVKVVLQERHEPYDLSLCCLKRHAKNYSAFHAALCSDVNAVVDGDDSEKELCTETW